MPLEEPSESPSFFKRRLETERPHPAPGLAPGMVVGDFRLIALIGQGGMGQIWEAQQISLERAVAVKFVRPERVTERHLELFAREARAGGRLHHPGIVTVHGHGTTEGLAWIAMELVGGGWTLRDFLDDVRRAGEVPPGYDRHVARFVAEIADAMEAAHAAHVIHRDMKPQNILITSEDRPKVTDFGLARITDEAALSATGDFAGTYLYMSPEQVSARRMGLDHRADVFSLGVVLYELLALQVPFRGDTEHQVVEQILTKDPPDPRTFRSRVPRDLVVIAAKALEKDRDRRYQTMADLAADLRRFLANEPIRARPPTRADRTVKWVKRHPTRSTAAAVVAVAFVAITLLLVANVRARAELSTSNRALAAKTDEAETRRQEAEESLRRALAGEELAAERLVAAEESAVREKQRADEVFRLSALQRLDDLVAAADDLWPAHPEILPACEDWLRDARALIAELSEHRRKLAELRARALPWTAEERDRHRAEHPLRGELEAAQRRHDHLARLHAALTSAAPARDPTPAEAGVDLAALPDTAGELNDLAWGFVDPDRAEYGEEARGLVLARHALELAAGLPAPERALIRDTLAWALAANGRLDEAVREEQGVLAEAADEDRPTFTRCLERLEHMHARETDPARGAERAAEIAELEARVADVGKRLDERPEWRFDEPAERWWHDQLDKLVLGLAELADPETGLASSGNAGPHGWGVEKRVRLARSIAERSVSGPAAARKWAEATASIADPAVCPAYGGLRITPRLGLLPLGRDPDSGLWEFAHLLTGTPPERGPDGRLVLEDETSLVFVLLPGGTCWMGAQMRDPAGRNYFAEAGADEEPVRAVTLAPFYLSKFEMTQGQWTRFAGSNPSYYEPAAELAISLRHPVEQVSWRECAEMCRRLGLRLPSEARWEYAARGGTTTAWWTGDARESLLGAVNLADQAAARAGALWAAIEDWPELDDGHAAHAPVGTYRPNPFGLHDVLGNVWEWCADGFDANAYYGGPVTDPEVDPAGDQPRVSRGGGFANLASEARSALRNRNTPDVAGNNLGLRPALDLAPSGEGD